ncbi:MAG: hypothetical protein ABSG79_05975 [Bryobacteraceae bacterium]|jgi:hypothetical protein
MRVRIRFARRTRTATRRNQRIALVVAALLTPAAAIAAALALWRIGADLNWANSFAIPSGIFSHWQVWLGAAAALQLCSRLLNKYGKGRDRVAS